MHHPTEIWYLAQARMDDATRRFDQPRTPRLPRPSLLERVTPRRHRRPSARVAAVSGPGLPMGCCA